MNFFHRPLFVYSLVSGLTLISSISPWQSTKADVIGCRAPALSHIQQHIVTRGETIESIAEKYNLLPRTIMAMNPGLHNGRIPVDTKLKIPPYNGIVVTVPPHQTWQQVAIRYKVLPDRLFEINGCQKNPRVVFVPIVPNQNEALNSSVAPVATSPSEIISGYPLANKTTVLLPYNWQINPKTHDVFFHSGVNLAAPVGTPVEAIASGIVVFAKNQGSYGNLVIINHVGGFQSRYAQLDTIKVRLGQSVEKGEVIGTVGTTGEPSSIEPHLLFEIRTQTQQGWKAEDPENYFPK